MTCRIRKSLRELSICVGGDESSLQQLSDSLPPLPKLVIASPQIRQRYLIEIWVEKSTLSDILLPLHHTYGVNIVTGGVGDCRKSAAANSLTAPARTGVRSASSTSPTRSWRNRDHRRQCGAVARSECLLARSECALAWICFG
jgi:hypothetical protein